MKRLSTIIMALALVLGMSQCKKQETPTNGNSGEMVHITLNVNDSESLAVNVNDNGGKHAVAPSLGVIQFTNGDKLYVGNNNHYVGYLNYVVDGNGRRFEGNIDGTACSSSDKLHFYFLGGKGPDVTTISGNPGSFTIDIANQTDNLPVLCYGASNEDYSTNGSYTASLAYKCALVKFDLENHGEDYSVTLKNVPTQATVNFANPTATTAIVATANQTNANMTLYGEPGNAVYRWAILLPGTNLSTGHSDLTITYSGDVNLEELAYNDYVNSGISINNPPAPALPNADLVIKNGNDFSVFTVSATGKKVYFSKANLTWNETEGYHFHATQFDEEHYGGSSVPDYSSIPATSTYSTTGDYVWQTNLTGLDRFTWGHIPNQSINSSYYLTNNQMATQGLNPEWGRQMTGSGNNKWRTLTAAEWNYLLHGRSGHRFMLVSVAIPVKDDDNNDFWTDCEGLLLFPDGFDYSALGLTQAAAADKPGFWPGWINQVYAAGSGYNTEHYNAIYNNNMAGSQTSLSAGPYKLIEKGMIDGNGAYKVYTNPNSNMYKLLAAGCVFLPGVGCRDGANYSKYSYYGNRNYAAQGFYWTSDPLTFGTQEKARYFWFGYVGGTNVETNPRPTFDANNKQDRDLGCCVRLVWDAN